MKPSKDAPVTNVQHLSGKIAALPHRLAGGRTDVQQNYRAHSTEGAVGLWSTTLIELVLGGSVFPSPAQRASEMATLLYTEHEFV